MANVEGKEYYGINIDNSELQEDANRSMSLLKSIGDIAEVEGSRIDNAFRRIDINETIEKGVVQSKSSLKGISDTAEVEGAKINTAFRKTEVGTIIQKGTNQSKFSMEVLGDTAEVEATRINNAFRNAAAGAAAFFTVQQATVFINKIIEVRGQFQKFEAVLTNALGSNNEARKIMDALGDFALSTPFNYDELVGAFVKLVNQGFKPTMEEMTKLGDLASSTGKSFDQLTEAIIDAQTGEMERLKEFGIRASKDGDKITFTFKEQETVVKNSASAIREYLLSLGEMKGVQGANAEIAKTLVTQVSNLQGAIMNMYNEIGQQTEGVLSDSISGVNYLVEHYEEVGKVIGVLVTTYGAYKAAVIVTTVVLREQAAVNAMVAASNSVFSKSLAYQWVWTERMQKAQSLLNKTMLNNPYVLLATVVAGLVVTMWALHDSTTASEKAQELLNKEHEEAAQRKQELTSKTDGLISKINSETDSVYSQVKAYKELLKLFPELKNMTLEEFKILPQDQQKKIFSNINDNREMDDAANIYDADLKRIEYLKKAISGVHMLPNSGLAVSKLNEQLETASNLAKLHKEEIDKIKEAQWEANTPVEEKVKHYKNIQSQLEKERDELHSQINPYKVLRTDTEDMAGSWFDVKDIIGNIKLDALNKQIEETTGKINSLTGNDKNAIKNKSYWEKKKKDAETARDTLDVSKKNSEEWNKYTREIQQAQKEIAKYDITGKAENETKKRLSAQQDLVRAVLDNELKLQADRIAIMKDGKDKRVLLADQEYKETIAAIQKEKEEYQKKVKESGGKESPAVLSTFTDRENSAKDKRNNDVANIAKEYSDQLKSIQNDVDSHFWSQLDNRLIEIDSNYKEQIKIAKEAGEEEEGDFIQMLVRKQQAEREYARKESALSTVDFKEQVDLGHLENKSNDTYFVEETERQKTEIVRKYALERITILDSMGDEQSKKDAELLRIAVEGYDKALSKPSKKSINNLIDEKAIKALQKRFMDLGMSEEEAKEKAIEYAEGFKGKMQMVADVADSLKTAFGGISDELDMALDAVSNIAQGFAEGGLIGGISAAAGQLVSVVSNLFTAKKEIDKSMVEGYETYMDAINDLIDTQVALLDKLGGMAFGQNIIDTTKDIAKSIAASRTLFNEAMRAGSGMFSHSDGYKANKMLKGYVNELREVGIYTTDLSQMTNEQLASLKKLPEVYARLPEGLRKYIDAIAEGIDKTEEFKDQIQDTVLGLDFTSITDMIVNSVTDPSIDNALEELEVNIDKTIASIAQNMLRRNMLLGPLEKMTNDLYKSMEKKDKDGNTYYKLTAESAKSFKDNVLGLGKQFQDAWKELEEAFSSSGIDLMPKDQETTEDVSDNSLKGAYAKANQESINLLAGQTGAQRVAIESIREQMQFIRDLQVQGWKDVTAIKELVGKLKEVSDKIYDAVDEIKGHTGELSEYSERTVNAVEGRIDVNIKGM